MNILDILLKCVEWKGHIDKSRILGDSLLAANVYASVCPIRSRVKWISCLLASWPANIMSPVGSIALMCEHVQLHSARKFPINIKFLVKLKKSATNSFQILTDAYEDAPLTRAYVFEWYKRSSG
ncbi:hypothetical protein TNCV_1808021 [Trichonephila clavipes]|nr:hypothetical protein TNCV_1808021 [Trichonephila clavipes]